MVEYWKYLGFPDNRKLVKLIKVADDGTALMIENTQINDLVLHLLGKFSNRLCWKSVKVKIEKARRGGG